LVNNKFYLLFLLFVFLRLTSLKDLIVLTNTTIRIYFLTLRGLLTHCLPPPTIFDLRAKDFYT